jgi:hypothetical protein
VVAAAQGVLCGGYPSAGEECLPNSHGDYVYWPLLLGPEQSTNGFHLNKSYIYERELETTVLYFAH